MAGSPADDRPLRLDGRARSVRGASLLLHIGTETWRDRPWYLPNRWIYGPERLSAYWHLEIDVDRHSGEDGAPAPDLQFAITHPQLYPARFEDISGLIIREPEHRLIQASYGNDAPHIEDNVMTFGPWLAPDRLRLSWTGCYNWGYRNPKSSRLAFDGEVAFRGISMDVKFEADAEPFLAHLFPQMDRGQFQAEWGDWRDLGRRMPRDRRRWRPITWRLKP